MAKRRARNATTLEQKRLAWEKRVRRTANKVRAGRVQIENVDPEVRGAVEEHNRDRGRG